MRPSVPASTHADTRTHNCRHMHTQTHTGRGKGAQMPEGRSTKGRWMRPQQRRQNQKNVVPQKPGSEQGCQRPVTDRADGHRDLWRPEWVGTPFRQQRGCVDSERRDKKEGPWRRMGTREALCLQGFPRQKRPGHGATRDRAGRKGRRKGTLGVTLEAPGPGPALGPRMGVQPLAQVPGGLPEPTAEEMLPPPELACV